LHVCSLGNAKSTSKGRCPAAHKSPMRVALHDRCLVMVLLKHKLTDLSFVRRHGQGCSITGTFPKRMACTSAESLQPHCRTQHRQAMSTNTHNLHNFAGARSMFSSDAARRAPGNSPADLPRPVKQGSDGTRKATKAMGIGSLAMSPQNSGKLAGKHHCSLPNACTKFKFEFNSKK